MKPACVIAGVVIVGDNERLLLPHRRSFDRLRQSEVEHLHRAVRRELDVGRFQVAVNDAGVVRRFERLADLPRHRQRFFNGKRSLGDPVGQRGSLDNLQHQRLRAAAVFETVDAADVGMTERGQHLRFALETGEPLGIVRERFWQDLQRDVTTELRIPRAIHLAHATLANRGQDFVRTYTCARSQCHQGGRDYRHIYTSTAVRSWDAASRARTAACGKSLHLQDRCPA